VTPVFYAPRPFASAVAALSEPGGYFDTDNLISNESSYQQVLPDLQHRHVHGGAYIGVGPDQNFTYIAATRPAVAYLVDIRRDNVLLHLLFKAIFHHARTRVEYLALLFGRAVPNDLESWRAAGVEKVAKYIEDAPKSDAPALRRQIDATIRASALPLTPEDVRTIAASISDSWAGSQRFQSTDGPHQTTTTYADLRWIQTHWASAASSHPRRVPFRAQTRRKTTS
jgi:hypothetical protein